MLQIYKAYIRFIGLDANVYVTLLWNLLNLIEIAVEIASR